LTSQVNFDITIVFPVPELVYTDIHMVVVPYDAYGMDAWIITFYLILLYVHN